MALYKDAECPVCKKAFEDGDDIVTCPECGTPHHRECYNYVGHCVNQGLHKSGYSFYDEHSGNKTRVAEPAPAPVGTFYTPDENTGEYTDNSEISAPENETADDGFFPFGSTADFYTDYERDTDRIDGETMADVAATVRSNTKRYVEKFRSFEHEGRRTSWNWGAFLFGPYFLFFRKMYKQGILLLSIGVAVEFGFSMLIARLAPKAYTLFGEAAEAAGTQNFEAFSQNYGEFMSASDYGTMLALMTAMLAALLFIRIIIAVFADYMYKGTVVSIIKKVKERLDDGASFSASPFSNPEGLSFTQEQMKRLYLSRKGGTSFLAPVAAMLAINILNTLL